MEKEKTVVGTKQTIKAITSGAAVKVYIAENANDYIKGKILAALAGRNIETVYVESMKKLGNDCGICCSAATAAVIK